MSHPLTFVDGLSGAADGPVRTGQSKLFHRKSRTGCQRCRTRRVKCNEAKPICNNCERKGGFCIYDRRGLEAARSSDETVQDSESRVKGPGPSPDDSSVDVTPHQDGEPSETRRRRILELELMHFYMTETGPSIAFDKRSSYDLFVNAIPRKALESDALLYSVYAFAALHQAKTTGGDNAVASERHELYLQLAFQHHHKELAQLSRANADVVCMTANLMRLTAFVVLSERRLVPYEPPLEWLRITKSHANMFRAAWDLVGDDSSTQTARIIRATPVAWDCDEREGADKRRPLQHLLLARDDDDDPDTWDAGVRRAYESAASYIGGTWQAMQRHDARGAVRRRLIIFPILVDERFMELVGEGRPRALVVMAHYFALLSILKSFWFIGNTGPREVRAIAAYLPARWQCLMEWPMRMIEGGLPTDEA